MAEPVPSIAPVRGIASVHPAVRPYNQGCDPCCGCMTLQAGAKIIAIVDGILGMLYLIFSVLMFLFIAHFFGSTGLALWLFICAGFVSVLAISRILLAVCLVIGAAKLNRTLCFIYLVGICIILCIEFCTILQVLTPYTTYALVVASCLIQQLNFIRNPLLVPGQQYDTNVIRPMPAQDAPVRNDGNAKTGL